MILPTLLAATSPIVIRHDVPDAHYLEFAREFANVCHVGAEGVGVLVAPRWVLTASHVAEGVGPFSAYVEFGGRGSGRPVTRLAVDQVHLHPRYTREDAGNDIALLRLSEPAEGIVPTRLLDRVGDGLSDGGDLVGEQVVLVGCGDVGTGESGARMGDGRWRAATNTVLEVHPNQLRFRFDAPGSEEVTELEGFWAGGDSGCPAFIERDGEWLVAGISSHGYGAERPGPPAQYGQRDVSYRVAHYLPWIRSVQKDHGASGPSVVPPVKAVDGQLPDTPLGALAAAYFDARTQDAEARDAFVSMHADPGPGESDEDLRRRIWKADHLPFDLGPFRVVEFAEGPESALSVLTRLPQIEEHLAFTFVCAPGGAEHLVDVKLLPVVR